MNINTAGRHLENSCKAWWRKTAAAEAREGRKVPQRLVDMMVKFYGSLPTARQAYATERAGLTTTQVLWVALSGRICRKESCEIFYTGSPDAYFVLPS